MEVGVHILYWYMYKEMYYSTLKYHSNALEMTVCIPIFKYFWPFPLELTLLLV